MVRYVDDKPVAAARSWQGEYPHRKPGADAEPDGHISLEASAVRDLTERRVDGDVGDLLARLRGELGVARAVKVTSAVTRAWSLP